MSIIPKHPFRHIMEVMGINQKVFAEMLGLPAYVISELIVADGEFTSQMKTKIRTTVGSEGANELITIAQKWHRKEPFLYDPEYIAARYFGLVQKVRVRAIPKNELRPPFMLSPDPHPFEFLASEVGNMETLSELLGVSEDALTNLIETNGKIGDTMRGKIISSIGKAGTDELVMLAKKRSRLERYVWVPKNFINRYFEMVVVDEALAA